MNKISIVVIGYNRVDSIQRLMTSLLQATYTQEVNLIISIDNSGTNIVEEYAKTIDWPFGEKTIKTFPERMGLRKHVLTCGNYINEFDLDAIIILEDDLFVSPDFFNYAVQTVEKYKNNKDVAGISLYSHLWNTTADRPFSPIYKGYDVYFMQYPQSWGQVWMKEQWNDFYSWYEEGAFESVDKNRIPENVLNWPESSWLKFHVTYCIDKSKYFVYPFNSLSTNFADAGTHYVFSTNKMQVPLTLISGKKYSFPESIDDTSVYDSHFESEQLSSVLELDATSLVVDLYGKKKSYAGGNYVLTTKTLPYRKVKSFGLQMRPWDLNVLYDIPGEDILLYDLRFYEKIQKQKHKSLVHWLYDTRNEVILKYNFVGIIWYELYSKIGYTIFQKLKKIKKK